MDEPFAEINLLLKDRELLIKIYSDCVLVFIELSKCSEKEKATLKKESKMLGIIINDLFPKPFNGLTVKPHKVNDLIIKNQDSLKMENPHASHFLCAIFKIDRKRYGASLEDILTYLKLSFETINKEDKLIEIAKKTAYKIFPEHAKTLYLD